MITVSFTAATKLYYVVPNDVDPADYDAADVKAGTVGNTPFAVDSVDLSGTSPQTFTLSISDTFPDDDYTVYVAEGAGGLSGIHYLDFSVQHGEQAGP